MKPAGSVSRLTRTLKQKCHLCCPTSFFPTLQLISDMSGLWFSTRLVPKPETSEETSAKMFHCHVGCVCDWHECSQSYGAGRCGIKIAASVDKCQGQHVKDNNVKDCCSSTFSAKSVLCVRVVNMQSVSASKLPMPHYRLGILFQESNAEIWNISLCKFIQICSPCPFDISLKCCPFSWGHGNKFCITNFIWYVIIHPCPNFNVGLVKLQLKLGHE